MDLLNCIVTHIKHSTYQKLQCNKLLTYLYTFFRTLLKRYLELIKLQYWRVEPTFSVLRLKLRLACICLFSLTNACVVNKQRKYNKLCLCTLNYVRCYRLYCCLLSIFKCLWKYVYYCFCTVFIQNVKRIFFPGTESA